MFEPMKPAPPVTRNMHYLDGIVAGRARLATASIRLRRISAPTAAPFKPASSAASGRTAAAASRACRSQSLCG